MKQLEDEFNASLQTISNLRRSSLTSVLLMIAGIIIVAGSLYVSVFKLKLLTISSIEKSDTISSLSAKNNTLNKELYTAKEQSLNMIIDSGGIGDPNVSYSPSYRSSRKPKPQYIPDHVSVIQEGWVYYGTKENKESNESWEVEYFDLEAKRESHFPTPGSVISSLTKVAVCDGYITFDLEYGWTKPLIIGYLTPNTKLKVDEVHPIFDKYIWVKVSPATKQKK